MIYDDNRDCQTLPQAQTYMEYLSCTNCWKYVYYYVNNYIELKINQILLKK